MRAGSGRTIPNELKPEVTMSMQEQSEAGRATPEAKIDIDQASQRAAGFMFGVQKLMLEELVFAGNELLERAQTEMHLFSELAAKMAAAHSVRDFRKMYEECAKHQIEFVRRDSDRLFKNGEHMIEAASKLFKSHPLN
jgi:hypothetical protein